MRERSLRKERIATYAKRELYQVVRRARLAIWEYCQVGRGAGAAERDVLDWAVTLLRRRRSISAAIRDALD
jgi:hypothetical protein